MALPEIFIGSKLDAKGFKQAETALNKLTKSVRKFAATFGVAFGATALVNYSKAAVKAFAADENAARSLGMTLKNLNLDYFGASSAVNMYISNLEKQTGVLDDELRPAMDRFLRATSSITESQKLLNLALDISSGTGKDLTAVSQGLQKAYLGNNASLGRLGVGLTKAELKSTSFLDIQDKLTKLFAGQAASAANSYAGSLAKLTVASNNAKEIIGGDLVNAMQLLAGDTGIGGTTTAIEEFATQVGNAVTGVSILIAKLKSIPGAGIIGQLLGAGAQVSGIGAITRLGANRKAALAGTPQQSPGQRKAIDKANADALKLQKSRNSLLTIDNSLTTRKITLTADQQALEELKKKFDVERIGLFAALNQATDDETKARIKSLIAIYDNDAALALKIKAELEAAEAARLLALSLAQSLTAWGNWQTLIGNSFGAAALAATTTITTPIEPAPTMPSSNYAPGDIPGISGQRGFRFAGADSSPTYVINAQGIGDQQIAAVVQGAIQDLNRYGSSTTYAGAI